ncbi:VOC family protein [Ekhidna sp. To15]|uniref:VOC family protein n=1 Tax=Ekhidna sp. To15 TaxID=3395267 RepID=UPI003F521D5D
MSTLRPFHLAVPVKDLEETRVFYREVMGFDEGRSSDCWVDFNFYGHQFVIHKVDNIDKANVNPVDDKAVPVPHFGVVLEWSDWESLSARLKAAKVSFIIEPYVRFEGEVGEQATMFFSDPSGNALEFKAFKNDEDLFAK